MFSTFLDYSCRCIKSVCLWWWSVVECLWQCYNFGFRECVSQYRTQSFNIDLLSTITADLLGGVPAVQGAGLFSATCFGVGLLVRLPWQDVVGRHFLQRRNWKIWKTTRETTGPEEVDLKGCVWGNDVGSTRTMLSVKPLLTLALRCCRRMLEGCALVVFRTGRYKSGLTRSF